MAMGCMIWVATSSSGASIFIVTIRPTVSPEVVVGTALRSTAKSPTVAGAAPWSATATTEFVSSDLFPKIPDPLFCLRYIPNFIVIRPF